eukprot:403362576
MKQSEQSILIDICFVFYLLIYDIDHLVLLRKIEPIPFEIRHLELNYIRQEFVIAFQRRENSQGFVRGSNNLVKSEIYFRAIKVKDLLENDWDQKGQQILIQHCEPFQVEFSERQAFQIMIQRTLNFSQVNLISMKDYQLIHVEMSSQHKKVDYRYYNHYVLFIHQSTNQTLILKLIDLKKRGLVCQRQMQIEINQKILTLEYHFDTLLMQFSFPLHMHAYNLQANTKQVIPNTNSKNYSAFFFIDKHSLVIANSQYSSEIWNFKDFSKNKILDYYVMKDPKHDCLLSYFIHENQDYALTLFKRKVVTIDKQTYHSINNECQTSITSKRIMKYYHVQPNNSEINPEVDLLDRSINETMRNKIISQGQYQRLFGFQVFDFQNLDTFQYGKLGDLCDFIEQPSNQIDFDKVKVNCMCYDQFRDCLIICFSDGQLVKYY